MVHVQISQRIQFSGPGDFVLDVLATDYKLFLISVGATTVSYVILSSNGRQWERGTGTLAIGGGLSRDSVLENHLGTTAKVDFDLGQHSIQVDQAGGSAAITVKEATATVSAAVTALDFGAGFDVSESPAGEANIELDLSEVTAFTDATADIADHETRIDVLEAAGGGSSIGLLNAFKNNLTGI